MLLRFPSQLIEGRLIKRYKRFLSDIELLTGETVTAHCANPGSMMGLATPGAPVWLSPSRNPARKLKYSWELVEIDGALVGINTGRANALVGEALPHLGEIGVETDGQAHAVTQAVAKVLRLPGPTKDVAGDRVGDFQHHDRGSAVRAVSGDSRGGEEHNCGESKQ